MARAHFPGAQRSHRGLSAQRITGTEAPDRTWLGWLSGFVAVAVVLGAAAGAVTFIRRRR